MVQKKVRILVIFFRITSWRGSRLADHIDVSRMQRCALSSSLTQAWTLCMVSPFTNSQRNACVSCCSSFFFWKTPSDVRKRFEVDFLNAGSLMKMSKRGSYTIVLVYIALMTVSKSSPSLWRSKLSVHYLKRNIQTALLLELRCPATLL